MNLNLTFDKSSFINTEITDIICNYHNEKFDFYCKSCSLDICHICIKSHFNHELINYQEIKPKKEEIKILKNTIRKYEEDYNKILSEIISWKKFLDNLIISFQSELKENKRLNDNINCIFNKCDNNMNFNSILKFRLIFENIIEPQKNINNKKILNYITQGNNNGKNNLLHNENKIGLYDYNKYYQMKLCLDKIINNKINENNFLLNSNYIIEFLWENYISDKNKLFDNNLYNNKKNNIIEKHIDLSINNKRINNKNKKNYNILEINKENINLNKTHTSFIPKIGNIFLDKNYLKLLNTTNNFNRNNINNIYYKKRSNSNNNIFWNKDKKNISLNINEFNTNLNINKINLYLKKDKTPTNNDKNLNIIFDKFIPKAKVQNRVIKNKENKNNTFIHKKFEAINLKKFISPKPHKYTSKTEKNKIKENNCYFNNTSSNKLSSTYTDSENIKQKLNFEFSSNETIKNNEMNYLINNELIKESEIIYKLSNDKINYNNNIKNSPSNNPFNIPKIEIPKICPILNQKKIKYTINSNETLCLALEIGNLYCKLGILNPNLNHQKIFSRNLSDFADDIFSFPFMLSFNAFSNEIEIGQEALNNYFLNNKSYNTIFDIINFFGKNTDEIFIKKGLYPYKIYSKENKPVIEINFNKKEKKFNFEDLFTIFIKKLFENFFEKIDLIDNNNNNKNIKLNLSISIPDDFNYLQRKIIEKIFQKQIFPSFTENNINDSNNSDSSHNKKNNKKLYNGYQIELKNIKIENASSIIHLSYNMLEDKKNINVLALISNSETINISLASINKNYINNEIKNVYEIKNEISIKKGERNILNNYIEQKINIEENENMININDINHLRKIYYEFILNINQNNIPNDELNKFILSLNPIYIYIISSIKNLLKKEKINTNNINHIIINGQILKTKSFIELLSNLFKENEEIQTQLNNKENILDNNIIIGAINHSYNLNIPSPFYILNNISNISFGVDSFGKMEFIIKKGNKLPVIYNKFIKIKSLKENDYLELKIYEGENKEIQMNRIITSINIDKKNFKNEKIGNDYIELLIQFELDKEMNLRVFVLDPKKLKKRFECLINIDIIKG